MIHTVEVKRNVATLSSDWASPPGDTILDVVQFKGWSIDEVSQRLSIDVPRVSRLIIGSEPLTDEDAARLAEVLGSTKEFWIAREAKYRAALGRLSSSVFDLTN